MHDDYYEDDGRRATSLKMLELSLQFIYISTFELGNMLFACFSAFQYNEFGRKKEGKKQSGDL